ncbi:ROK family protein [Pseudovibrio exalbescens]|uniref:ROK family protein n=1 Tax=Pseudovibrio exalbescens TaxID=197461 RepID=UPI000C99B81A|nr:ROK family protein [Pseudovibrio exalbescens]
MMVVGGIDLGGSKIETTAFTAHWQVLATRRVPTPATSYDNLLAVLAEEIAWLKGQSSEVSFPIGVGTPGLNARTHGFSFAANLEGGARNLKQDLSDRVGQVIWFENDANCFALSEALLGAGRGHGTVFGLILGTGVGGGYVVNGRLLDDLNGASGEVGHLGIPAALVRQLDLPLFRCGCGQTGCYETLLSGPGLARLHTHFGGTTASPREIAARDAAGEPVATRALSAWIDLLASLVAALQATYDPRAVVIGGGLSNLPNLTERLEANLPEKMLPKTQAPALQIAEHGDSSGAWGAALAAQAAWQV